MYSLPNGEHVRGFVSSDDLTTAAAVSLVGRNGSARSLVAGERLVITDIILNNGGTASVITVFQDTDGDNALDSGEELYAASLAANGNNAANLSTPVQLAPHVADNVLMVVASAASAGTRLVFVGYIVKS